MKLLIVLITHDRLAYTERTLKTLLETIKLPHFLVVVDNASTDGTRETLEKRNDIDIIIANKENRYPGAAANQGWEEGLKMYPHATHLMRCDNDMEFLPGWDLRAEEYFKKIDRLGQLGLDYDGGENKPAEYYNGMGIVEWPGCVGGPNIIRREIFDNGIRYDETRWEGTKTRLQEDAKLSHKLKNDGWLVGHMDTRLSFTFATPDTWKDYPEYYRKTFTDRNYPELVEIIDRMPK